MALFGAVVILAGPLVTSVILFICKIGDVGNIGNWSWWWVTCPLWASTLLYWGGKILVIVIGAISTIGGRKDGDEIADKVPEEGIIFCLGDLPSSPPPPPPPPPVSKEEKST